MKRPVAAVCSIITRGNLVLLGQRKGCVCDGAWAFPGGHLEGGESFEQCAARELAEETGMTARHVEYITTLNIVNYVENRHFVDIYMAVQPSPGEEPKITEDFCSEWLWCPISNLPSPLMPGTEKALIEYMRKRRPSP